MIAFNERKFESFIRGFGEDVAANYANLPALPGPGFRWSLVVECEYSKDSTSVRHRWVAEPCETKP